MPLGSFFVFHDEPTCKLKRIGGRLSYHYHHKRSEAFTIDECNGVITMDGQDWEYAKGQLVLISQGLKHQIVNKEDEKVVFIKIKTGSYFGEDSIIRI